MDDFGSLPGNSHTSKLKKEQQESSEEPEAAGPIPTAQKQYDEHQKTADQPDGTVKKVVSGNVVKKRKPLGVQFKEMFASKDEQSFIDYLLNDVAVPMVQEMMINMVGQTLDGIKNGIEDRITGGSSQSRTSRTTSYGTGRPVVNYNAQYRSSNIRSGRPTARATAPAPRVTIRRSNRVQDIFLETREDGMDVLDELRDKISGFGHCTVGDLYQAVGETPVNTDHEWGWDDLDEARVRRIATGEFQLVVPRPIPIQFES
jgi:hypothetical protein